MTPKRTQLLAWPSAEHSVVVRRSPSEQDVLARSYLSDGRVIELEGPGLGYQWAIDGELASEPPMALARLLGADGFWETWTRLEVFAKLRSVPIVVMLGRRSVEPLPSESLFTTTLVDPGGCIVMSVGVAVGVDLLEEGGSLFSPE